jgi:hypothetical protein
MTRNKDMESFTIMMAVHMMDIGIRNILLRLNDMKDGYGILNSISTNEVYDG